MALQSRLDHGHNSIHISAVVGMEWTPYCHWNNDFGRRGCHVDSITTGNCKLLSSTLVLASKVFLLSGHCCASQSDILLNVYIRQDLDRLHVTTRSDHRMRIRAGAVSGKSHAAPEAVKALTQNFSSARISDEAQLHLLKTECFTVSQ